MHKRIKNNDRYNVEKWIHLTVWTVLLGFYIISQLIF